MKIPSPLLKLAFLLPASCLLAIVSVTQSHAGPADTLTNGLISYWPLQSTNGGIYTPDLVSGYNLLPIQGNNVQVGFGPGTVNLVLNARTNGAGVVRNAMQFANANSTLLGFKAPLNSAGLTAAGLPPTQYPSWTLSFWFQSSVVNGNVGNRMVSFANQSGLNSVFDIEGGGNGGGATFTGGYDFFIRQSSTSTSQGTLLANLFGGIHRAGNTNGLPAMDGNWHNVTVVMQLVTNFFHPVVAPIQAPQNGGTSVTFTWTSTPLDSAFGNNSNQVDSTQQYILQVSTDLSSPANWVSVSTNTTLGYGPALSTPTTTYTYNNATNPNAYYRIVSPGVRLQVEQIYIDLTNYSDSTALAVNPTTGNLAQNTNVVMGLPIPNGNNYSMIFPNQYALWAADEVGLGGLYRASPAVWFNGFMNDVAIWNRALSSNEIAVFVYQGVTNNFPPPALTVALTADFPTVATNDIIPLSWLGSSDATFSLTPGPGNVTSVTTSGAGSTNLTVLSNTLYTMTVTRSGATNTSSVLVTTVSNVTSNWRYIDSFNPYLTNGLLDGQALWTSPSVSAFSGAVKPMRIYTSSVDSNEYIAPDGSTANEGGLTGRSLKSDSIVSNAVNTLFFRFYLDPVIGMPDNNNLGGETPDIDITVGLTDKAFRDPADYGGDNNDGPGIRIIKNTGGQGNPGPIDFQANNGPAGTNQLAGYSFTNDVVNGDTNGLTLGKSYSVWIDVTNMQTVAGTNTYAATYSVYLQREDWPSRSNLFSGFYSDRGVNDTNAFTPFIQKLTAVFLTENSTVSPTSTNVVRFDDFYISKSGVNSTFPLSGPAFPGGSLAP